MEKYGDVEKAEVLRGEEAQVLNQHMERTGRYSVSDFNKTQKEALQRDLEEARARMESEGGSVKSSRDASEDERSSDSDS